MPTRSIASDERRRAAVHDRHFLAVDLDDAVVDLEAAEGGEKMLDCGDGDAVLVADHRAECEILDVADLGGDFSGDATAFGDDKTEPGIGRCRMQVDRNRRSAVHPRATNPDLAGNRRLSRANESI